MAESDQREHLRGKYTVIGVLIGGLLGISGTFFSTRAEYDREKRVAQYEALNEVITLSWRYGEFTGRQEREREDMYINFEASAISATSIFDKKSREALWAFILAIRTYHQAKLEVETKECDWRDWEVCVAFLNDLTEFERITKTGLGENVFSNAGLESNDIPNRIKKYDLIDPSDPTKGKIEYSNPHYPYAQMVNSYREEFLKAVSQNIY